MTRWIALELAPEEIRFNAIAPGVVWTPITERLLNSLSPVSWSQVVRLHPLGIGNPEDVANAVAFLLSPSVARWITGMTLSVDGGSTAD